MNGHKPVGSKWATPPCINCHHADPHWIAAGQDICTHDGCDCECDSRSLDARAPLVPSLERAADQLERTDRVPPQYGAWLLRALGWRRGV